MKRTCHLITDVGRSVIDCGPPDEAEVQGGDYVGLTDTKYGATFSVNCTRLNAQLGGTDYPGDDQVVQCGEDGNWNFGSILCRGEVFIVSLRFCMPQYATLYFRQV